MEKLDGDVNFVSYRLLLPEFPDNAKLEMVEEKNCLFKSNLKRQVKILINSAKGQVEYESRGKVISKKDFLTS